MKKDLHALYEQLKKKGLTPAQQKVIEIELRLVDDNLNTVFGSCPHSKRICDYNDLHMLQNMVQMNMSMLRTHSIDDLVARDIQREKDGFPRKIRIGKMIKPSHDGDDKVVIVPTTVEEKLLHDQVRVEEEEGEGEGGSGDGEEGEVIGEQPVREEQEGEGGAGQGEGGSHEAESNAYDMGRILTEQFQLPNLKDKGKKRSLTRYTYDLTDKNRGFGQIIDKKATLRRIVQTNIALGRISTAKKIEPDNLLVSPADRVYRILSRERDYEF